MPTTAPDSRLHVAVGILYRADHRLLVQQRVPGALCAGQWEFPGGKIESGESPRTALARELHEELGIAVRYARRWLQLPFDYPHARVWLEVFVVDSYSGQASGQEGQNTKWLTAAQIRQLDVLKAVHPILDALDTAENVWDAGDAGNMKDTQEVQSTSST